VTQNYELPVAEVTVTATDPYGNPVASSDVQFEAQTPSSQPATSSVNPDGFNVSQVTATTTGSNGSVTIAAAPGETIAPYGVSAYITLPGVRQVSYSPTLFSQGVANPSLITVSDGLVINFPTGPAPATPANFTATIGSDGAPLLTWGTVPGATNYVLDQNGVAISIDPSNVTQANGVETYHDTNVSTGSYVYSVASDSNNGPSQLTAQQTVQVGSILNAPNVSGGLNDGYPSITWTDQQYSSPAPTGYEIFRDGQPIQYDNMYASFNFTDYAATPGTHTYTVEAISGSLTSMSAGVVLTAGLPGNPTNLNVPSPTLSPVLTWTGDSRAKSYNIYANGILISNTTSTTYTDTTPTPGEDTYYVTGVNSTGEGGPSNIVSVNVESAPTITSASSVQFNARAVSNFTVTTTGNPTPTISESGSLPTGITFIDNGDGTASLSGQASTTNSGYYFITITASSSAGTISQRFTLSVNNVQAIPTL
jgi:hypothetical protein